MEKNAKQKLAKPLSNADLAPLIDQYVNTNACWYLSPRSELDASPKQPIRAELIIEQNGQQIGKWELNPRTYGSIVLRHLQAQAELYTVPHAIGYHYENYEQLKTLKEQEWRLLMDLQHELNKMLWARYTLDDTAGIDLQQAVAWWERSERVEAAISLEKIWKVRAGIGSPLFKGHSDYLAELLAPLQAGYEGLESFMAECPPPTVTIQAATEEQTDGKGQRYKERHWYTNGEYGDGPILHNYYCPYNELEPIPGSVNGMRIKERFYPNAPVEEYAPFDSSDAVHSSSAQDGPVRAQLLHIRQLIDTLLGQID
ncbi:hypothetical protein E4631_23260 [Hymenobacter sp. UV11]|uniref:hypothetical protein n=1 Tax=Hymenobacter sp. UV11 TaxID=1849735 RepID=UPI00105D9137|nr:hypothetical protein [Hymenobacter sp. UV11]TFZ63226.1 hypothetical protein E4631_23260 [Hymenobacter sp. UV11]